MVSSVKVIHGPSVHTFNWTEGTMVLSVRRSLVDAFNIPECAVAFINGKRVSYDYSPRSEETLEFVVPNGRKGGVSLDDILSFVAKHLPLESWNEDKTVLKSNLFLESESYQQTLLFDLPPVLPEKFSENFLVSPNGSFAYQNRILPAGFPLDLHGVKNGKVVFNGDVTIPTLIDMTVDQRDGERFPAATLPDTRAKWGAVWMSLTPSEMLTQRPGVQKAQGTVVIGGLGLGWLLRKVCEKDFVERVIVVERSQELLDWYGYDLCQRHPKVSDVICDDVYNQIGKHGDSTMNLLDIWLLFTDAKNDRRLRAAKRRLKERLWAWGL